ncbi:methionine-R-sulfoxide reductase B3, mitochondrial-like [Oncorhynchus clarkii lewisi]|uniref:methionine-R-sulfoxide reductase B3, mitochondrial-like n=1 Tax=Oncorhynchus clarkii lewisi TaxID=490388 RepID=UPI0039B9308F
MAVLLRRVGRVALQLSLRQTRTPPQKALLIATLLDRSSQSEAAMSGFNLLHLITNAKPVTLKPCGLPSGTCRTKKTWPRSFSQEELKKRLSPIQFHVTQEKGTESAFRGEYTEYKEDGIYTCVVCGSPLFKSETKFDSGSGRFDTENILTLTRYPMTSSGTDQPPHKARQR